MTVNGFHQPFAETLAAMIFMDEDITQPRERCVITDDARKPDLLVRMIDAKDKRVLHIARDDITCAPLCPISAREHVSDRVNIKPRGVGADGVKLFLRF